MVEGMKYWAHTVEGKGEDGWHKLASHLKETGVMMSSFACKEEYKQIFLSAGYLHDLGKYQPRFQDYLKNGGRKGSVPHSSFGAGYSLLIKNQEMSFVIDGHHKGLPDRADWKNDVTPYHKGEVNGFDDIIKTFFLDSGIEENFFKTILPAFESLHERELFTRYLFSSLVDSDWLDTEKNCKPDVADKRIKRVLEYDSFSQKLASYLNGKKQDGELNQLRNDAREFAVSKAEMPVGFFSMNLPTGMGKTLTSLAWALKHGKSNSLKRIIIVLPFINIIDQTSSILEELFGEESILEHHSGIGDELSFSENINDYMYQKRLACENWDYPIIVTTTVQFFESIFNNKPSKCRKIHNIAESVVIFDEVQSLPKQIIEPTLTMLNNIKEVMNTSFLFCTATLPAFEKRDNFKGIKSITPLVDNPAELFKKTRRVTFHPVNHYEPVDYGVILDIAETSDSAVLVVFNTKKSAKEFFSQTERSILWEKRYHLSTAMCPVHRKNTINDIREDLFNNKKIMVSSTQLIEAGVDFDFPCVFREMAPLESIIQAAGRCNRENRMENYGSVYLFRLADSAMPDKLYRTSAGFAEDMIKENPDSLHNYDLYPEYYKKLISLFVDGDARKINSARENFNFETVSNSYRIIDRATKGLLVYNYNDDSKRHVDFIKSKQYLSRDDYRKMQVFIVQVYDSFIFNNRNSIEETTHGVMIWYGGYDKDTGISVDPIESDSLVV